MFAFLLADEEYDITVEAQATDAMLSSHIIASRNFICVINCSRRIHSIWLNLDGAAILDGRHDYLTILINFFTSSSTTDDDASLSLSLCVSFRYLYTFQLNEITSNVRAVECSSSSLRHIVVATAVIRRYHYNHRRRRRRRRHENRFFVFVFCNFSAPIQMLCAKYFPVFFILRAQTSLREAFN